jgi:hypothetical protein
VTHSARSLLWQAWVLLVLAAIGAALAGPASAQAPDPAPPRLKSPRPDPAPTGPREPARSAPAQSPRVTVRARSVEPPPPPAVAPRAPVAPQPSFEPPAPRPTPQRARVETPKKPSAAKPKQARTPSRKRAVKRTLRAALQPIHKATDSSPDSMLLAGGVALFVLSLGQAIFLALSVRFLRTS